MVDSQSNKHKKREIVMRTRRKSRLPVLFAAVLVIAAVALLMSAALRPKITDPHEGQVYVYDGFDWIWYTPLEGVEANTMTKDDFDWQGSVPFYVPDDYEVLRGVDVSEHQYDIDWQQVKASGIDFAFVRVGRRGYSAGALKEDEYFRQNLEGALNAGLEVGVYFFSQAISVQEAIEEAEYTLELIKPYSGITLPVVYDWEKIYEDSTARTAGLDTHILSDCAVAYCETIKRAGYTPCVYFNRHTGYYGLDLSRMTDYLFWFALPESPFPNFYYKVDIWQYSFDDTVPGIPGETDMNLFFRQKEA